MGGLNDVEGYGVIGGLDPEEELEPSKADINAYNEWHKNLKQYLLSGKLKGGTKAVRQGNLPSRPRLVSNRQRAALRR